MEQILEADSRSAYQETPCPSCNPTVHYNIHKSPPSVRVLSQMNLVHTSLLTPGFIYCKATRNSCIAVYKAKGKRFSYIIVIVH